jgi:polysaccharide chain length determinant protein (PEP-CTERM system associated)
MDEKTQKGLVLELIRGIWSRRKWLAILLFVLSFSFAWGLAAFLPDLYRSTAIGLVENRMVSETFVKSSVTGEPETRLQTISQKILGRSQLEDLINRLDLYPELRGKSTVDEIVGQMRKAIKLEVKKVEPNTDQSTTIAFSISYLGSDPQKVARVANSLLSLYVEENQNFRKEQAHRTAELLRDKLQDYREQLTDQERKISSFKKEHSVELLQQSGANLAVLDRLNTQLRINNDRLTRALERRNTLAKQLVGTDASIPVGDPVMIAARLVKLNEQLKELSQAYSDKYPDVVRVENQIAFLKRQLADAKSKSESAPRGDSGLQLLKKTFNDVDSEINELEREERRLEKELAVYQERLENAPKREQELQEIAPDYLAIKDQYNILLKQYEEAQLAKSVEQQQSGEEFRILDPALPPTQPAAPNRSRLLLLGLMFSLGMAAGAVVLVEQLDTSFHSVDDLRAFTKLPVLMNIPKIMTPQDVRRKRWRFLLRCLLALAGLMFVVAISYFLFKNNQQLALMLMRSPS